MFIKDNFNVEGKLYNEGSKVKTNFGYALDLLKRGYKVCRKGWNGKGMFIYYVPANNYSAIKNVDGTVSMWVPSINDCLAEDWEVVE